MTWTAAGRDLTYLSQRGYRVRMQQHGQEAWCEVSTCTDLLCIVVAYQSADNLPDAIAGAVEQLTEHK